jgi:hypothetical protein
MLNWLFHWLNWSLLILYLFLYHSSFPVTYFTFIKWTCIKPRNAQFITVTKWSNFASAEVGRRLILVQSSELLLAETSKKKLLLEISLIGPVQNLGVYHKFIFPSHINLLRSFQSLKPQRHLWQHLDVSSAWRGSLTLKLLSCSLH